MNEFDNDSLPDVKILPGPSVEFGEIEFDTPVTKTIEISNVGQVRFYFHLLTCRVLLTHSL